MQGRNPNAPPKDDVENVASIRGTSSPHRRTAYPSIPDEHRAMNIAHFGCANIIENECTKVDEYTRHRCCDAVNVREDGRVPEMGSVLGSFAELPKSTLALGLMAKRVER